MSIFEAAISGQLDDVKRCLAEGTAINSRDSNGDTPLMLAAVRGQLKVLRYLIQAGANLNLVNWVGHSALGLAIYSSTEESIKEAMVLALLHSGANPSIEKAIISKSAVFGTSNAHIAALCLAYGAKQLHSSDVHVNVDTHGMSAVDIEQAEDKKREAYEELLNNPLSLQSQAIRYIRRCVGRENIPQLKPHLTSDTLDACLNPCLCMPANR